MKRCVLFLLLIQVLAIPALAQQQRIIVTKTRFQVLFGELESEWIKAVQQKDTAALDRILGEEFTVWTPAPGFPTIREDWQAEAFKRPPQAFRIEDITVRSLSPTICVASLRIAETFGAGDSAVTERYFVVDVWIGSGKGDHWKVSDRYISRIPDSEQKPKGDEKPTGKD